MTLDPSAEVVESAPSWLDGWWPWLVGGVAGLLVLGPALRAGALFNLDLVVTDSVPVPSGFWGLGPALPRRGLFNLLLIVPGIFGWSGVAWRVLILACFGGAFAGAARLARPAGLVGQTGSGVLYALSPFVLTRVGVGHTGLVLAAALLPWALPTLAQPTRRIERTFLWLCAFGVVGFFGGTIAGALVLVALLVDRPPGALRVVAALVVSQLPWILPGIAVAAQGPDPSGTALFAARTPGVTGALGLLAGHGFWQDLFQVGGNGGLGVAILGLLVLGLALRGHRELPTEWRRVAGWAAVLGLALPLFSSLPLTRELWELAAETPVVAPIREVQRLLLLYVVWAAPAAACGAWALARSRRDAVGGLLAVVPLAAGLLLAGPGLWSVGGQLAPVDLPPEWEDARRAVRAEDGTVLALPWAQYFNLGVAGNRRVHHPAPFFLGGDVMISSDPGFARPAREQADPREGPAAELVERIRNGENVASELADLGVRWVFLLRDIDWEAYEGLFDDPQLEAVVEGDSLVLLHNRAWAGPVLVEGGEVLDVATPIAPVGSLPASDRALWFRPAQRGWLRGWTAATEAPGGVVALPAGGGLVWFWPALLVVGGYAVTGGLALAAAWRLRSSAPEDGDTD